ncbi:metallophosphoesterase family protein [Proteiniclasticum sp. C24MP]|uniref:metallophosphoesterase family protein n=1 Tax=Proteiniclasticum sp. C24MP TaxID=3374101 RepID=UPI003754E178
MRIAIVSDTHKSMSSIRKVCEKIERENPDLILHLGDVMEDADVMEAILGREVRRVPGNCDYAYGMNHALFIQVEKIGIYAVHGHEQGVKRSLRPLAGEAAGKGAKIALYGHTHVAREEDLGGVHLLNPGSAALPKNGQEKSMAFLKIRGKEFSFDIVPL